MLLGILLYVGSYAVLVFWRRRGEVDDEEVLSPFSTDDEIVYKISFAICAFSLAVSVGAALLLPVSTISNEVLHRYPSSWFLKWLNTSLIHGEPGFEVHEGYRSLDETVSNVSFRLFAIQGYGI